MSFTSYKEAFEHAFNTSGAQFFEAMKKHGMVGENAEDYKIALFAVLEKIDKEEMELLATLDDRITQTHEQQQVTPVIQFMHALLATGYLMGRRAPTT